jgi:hypothetical protein
MELTRRRDTERPDCWHVYFGDVHIGKIAMRPGVPFDEDQWGWIFGLYPASHRGVSTDGTAANFEQARADFEAAWHWMQPQNTEADFQEHRRQRAWTAWKYAMRGAGAKLPTETVGGRSKCFCGAPLDIRGMSAHVSAAHTDMQ